MTKQKPNNKSSSPVEQMTAAEQVLQQLEQKRQACAERAVQYTEVRDRLAFRAHAQQDPEAGRELAEAREHALAAERELGEIDTAFWAAARRSSPRTRSHLDDAASLSPSIRSRRGMYILYEYSGRQVMRMIFLLI